MVNCAPRRPPSDSGYKDQRTRGLFQLRPRRARQPHRTEKLQRESIGPILVRQCLELAALGRPCVVHQDVDGPELGASKIGEMPGILGLAEIESDGRGGTSAVLDFLHRMRQRLAVARAHHHSGAFLRQPQRDGSADSPARTGYDGGLSREFHDLH